MNFLLIITKNKKKMNINYIENIILICLFHPCLNMIKCRVNYYRVVIKKSTKIKPKNPPK